MNTEKALERMGLDDQATPEAIEKVYRKLTNRYPPEFHPERFRQVDEAYRFLSSYPRRVEMLFSPNTGGRKPDMGIFGFAVDNSATLLEEGLAEVRRLERMRFLWGKGE